MFPIRRGDGQDGQRPEKAEDVKYWAFMMAEMGKGGGHGKDGIADQAFLDAFFGVVNSSRGGSYISGEEGAYFTAIHADYYSEDAAGNTDAYTKAQADAQFAKLKHPHTIT